MGLKIQSAIHPSNNFDFIRIVAATLVLFSHHFALMARKEPTFFQLHSIGGMAVLCFFSISGYLVTQSWFSDPNAWRFTVRRIVRIWPALIFAVTLTALLIGPIATNLSAHQYFNHPATWDYFNIVRLKIYYVLPGVFEKNPYQHSVNGSLWTIPIEVGCYATLCIAGMIGALKRPIFLIALSIAYFVWYTSNSSPDLHKILDYEKELGAYFLMGATIFCIQKISNSKFNLWSGILIIIAAITWFVDLRYTALLIGLPAAIIWLGMQSFPVISRFGRWGDPSYGLYLFAFPIQQSIIAATPSTFGFKSSMFTSFFITTIIAYSSWHLIEKNALKFKPRSTGKNNNEQQNNNSRSIT